MPVEETVAPSPDSLRDVFQQIRRTGLLSAGQERELFRRLERGDQAARERLVLSNLGLVVSIANRYAGGPLPAADLVQEGVIGLMRAVDKFEWRRGFRFSTYATWWIGHAVRRALDDRSRLVRLPVALAGRTRRLDRAEWALTARLGRAPSEAELADAARLEVEQVRAARGAPRVAASLDQPVGPHDPTPIGSLWPDDAPALDEAVPTALDRPGLHLALAAALAGLPERDRLVLELHYGLRGRPPVTLAAIGRRLGLSRERVRQIEHASLERLAEDRGLRALRPAA